MYYQTIMKRLDEVLKANEQKIINFAKNWIGTDKQQDKKSGFIRSDIAIFYLGYVLAGETRDHESVKNYIALFKFSEDVIDKILNTYNLIEKDALSNLQLFKQDRD